MDVAIQRERYLRQMVLPGFRYEGQQKLTTAKVLVIGCGGLGCPVLQYLAAAGVGKLTLCDDDRIEMTNLNRQILFTQTDIGKFKSEQAAKVISDMNPLIQIDFRTEKVNCHNIKQLISGHDCIVDCTDGLPSKFLINDAAILENCPLIHGSAIGYQGRFMVIKSDSACLRCFFQDRPDIEEMPTCSTLGILGPICGVVGSFMATEALKLLINGKCNVDQYTLINCASGLQIKQFEVQKNINCSVCSANNYIKHLRQNDYNFACTD